MRYAILFGAAVCGCVHTGSVAAPHAQNRAEAEPLVTMTTITSVEQPTSDGLVTYTLDQAVDEALAHHPQIVAARASEKAASARVDEARFGVLPAVGVSAQLNRSTGNTAPGAFFPTQGFPPIAGPLRTKSLDEGTWQTGVSLWASWDVMSIARQAAAVDIALAARHESAAKTTAEQLDVAYRASDAYMQVLEAQETVRAARANATRAQTLVDTTKPLVDQTLRPGVDLARAEAELASARTFMSRVQQTLDVRRAQLAEAIGRAGISIEAQPGELLAASDSLGARAGTPADNPKVVEANAVADRASAVSSAVKLEYLPRVDLVAALWARGSGLDQSPADGLVPDIANWAAGVTITWSILDIPRISARARAASADYAAALARRDEVVLAVSGELATSDAALKGALRVAHETPIALAAARGAYEQALARYKASLIPVVDLADAQRVLAQAEVDDANARIDVHRARLLFARAAGNIAPFLGRR